MSVIKKVTTGLGLSWLIIPMIGYAITPLIFYNALKLESMVIMNLTWDVVSDILVTAAGILYFKEKISGTKMMGVILSLFSVFLMTYEGDGWGEYMEAFFAKLAVN